MARRRRYRGRGRIRRALTVISVFLGILLVLAMVLWAVLPNYLKADPVTNRFYLDIPILNTMRRNMSTTPPLDTLVPPPITPDPTPDPTPEPTAEPTPVPKSLLPIRALYVPQPVLSDPNALAAIREQMTGGQAGALVVELKAADSTLAYPTELPAFETFFNTLKASEKTAISAKSDAAVQLIRDAKAAGVYVAARIACFKDARLPQMVSSVGVKVKSGVNWLDKQKGRWLDPYKPEARDYLLGVLNEVAGLGVDEILLDWVSFPTEGGLSSIYYGAAAETPRYGAIEDFTRQARGVADSCGVTLSMVLGETVCIAKEDETSGQRLSGLAPLLDRVYFALPLSDETGAVFEELTAGLKAYLPRASWPSKLVPMLPADAKTKPEDLSTALDAAGGQLGMGWVLENDKGQYPDFPARP